MGEDGARRVVVNSVGREIRTLDEVPPVEGPPRAADDRLRDAEGGRRGVPRTRLLGLGGRARSAHRRRADAREPAGVRSERVRRRHRSRDVAGAQHRQAAAAAESRDPGPLFARLDVQDRGRDGGARRGRDHARRTRSICPGGGTFYGRYFKCHSRAATAPSTCGTRSRSRATSTSTRSATCSASTGSTSGPRSSVSRGKSGIDLPNESREHRAVDRVEAAAHRREVVSGRDDLGGDRPGPGVGDADVDWR